jgi:hypothetical protein
MTIHTNLLERLLRTLMSAVARMTAKRIRWSLRGKTSHRAG